METIPYASADTRSRISKMAVVAFVTSIIANPLMCQVAHTRPFWTGHPLGWLQPAFLAITGPQAWVAVAISGFIALCRIYMSRGRLRGKVFAWVATLIGAGSSLLMLAAFMMMARLDMLPSPN